MGCGWLNRKREIKDKEIGKRKKRVDEHVV
jgi:hypothetical protein